MAMQDLTGQKFGKLTVISFQYRNGRKYYWLCKCDCGNEIIVEAWNLKSGHTKACGCLVKKHGLRYTRLYNIWQGMKSRCTKKYDVNYKRYGARGITVCQEWLDDFMNFYNWAYSNGYSDELSIDRINNNGNYEPKNCRWADAKTQARNTRRNHIIKIGNEAHCLSEWAEIKNLNIKRIEKRLSAGWDEIKAISTPIREYKRSA